MQKHLKALNDHLKAEGLNSTREREEILRRIVVFGEHFEAERFLCFIRRRGLKVSRPTFYRTLNLFLKAGIIGKSNLEDGRVIYENLLSGRHHDHLVCTQCGVLIEFADPEIERQQEKICAKYKFSGLRHQMQIFGLCQKCGRKKGIN